MTAAAKLAIAFVPGALIILAAYWLLRCPHRHRVLERAGATMGLRCARCWRWEPHPWREGA